MKRVNYHLTEKQLKILRELSIKEGLPVAELIRRAVDMFLKAIHSNNSWQSYVMQKKERQNERRPNQEHRRP